MSVVDRALAWSRDAADRYRVGKFLAAVLVGIGFGVAVSTEPVPLPVVGPVPSLVVGGAILAVGVVAFTRLPTSRSGCDCDGECRCS